MAYIKKVRIPPTACKVCSRAFSESFPNVGQAFCQDCKREYFRAAQEKSRSKKILPKVVKGEKVYRKSFREFRNNDLLNELKVVETVSEYVSEDLLDELEN
jgi:hypothetical protein